MSHWSWEHFVTDGTLYKNNHSNKNAWCKQCLAHHVDMIRGADIVAVATTGMGQTRTTEEVEAQAQISCPPMAGKPKQCMVPHLSKCIYVDPSVRAVALGQASNTPTTTGQFAILQHLSQPPGPSLLSTKPLTKRKHMWSSYEDSPLSSASTGKTTPWTSTLQSEFGEDMCKLLIAICAPWNATNNPQMCLFMQKWLLGAVVPDRRTLSGPILDQEAAKVEDKLKEKLKGKLATFTTDGWKNKAKQSIVASMVSIASEW
ncbi:hypothetical protein EDB87DRAFT_1827458 [Lactarius vividus]|nr:hypothetical protein EDB87DRAFT_1827458 [Lactarius vividus]